MEKRESELVNKAKRQIKNNKQETNKATLLQKQRLLDTSLLDLKSKISSKRK